MSPGSHTFQVKATDGLGNTDPTPASYTWTVDSTAPDTTIDSGPPNPSTSSSATFRLAPRFSSDSRMAEALVDPDHPVNVDYFLGVAGTGFGSMKGFLTASARAVPLGADEALSLMRRLLAVDLLVTRQGASRQYI